MVLPEKKLSVYEPLTLGNRRKCWYCGKDGKTNSDHFYPKSLGGRLKLRSCTKCNIQKADRTPLEWIMRIDLCLEKCLLQQGCNGISSSFIRSYCEANCPEKAKLTRMRNATQSLWNRIKWSVK